MVRDKKYIYAFLHVPKCAGISVRRNIQESCDKDVLLKCYSVDFHLQEFGEKNEIIPLDHVRELQLDQLRKMNEFEKDKIQVIYGHEVFYGIHKFFKKKVRYIMLLRDPYSRIVSLYNYYVGSQYDVMERLLKDPEDIEAKFLKEKLKNELFLDETNKIPDFECWAKNAVELMNTEGGFSRDSIVRFLTYNRFIDGKPMDRFVDIESIKNALKKFYFIGILENGKEDLKLIYNLLGIKEYHEKVNVSKKYYDPKNNILMKQIFKETFDVDYLIYEESKKQNESFKKTLDPIFYSKVRSEIFIDKVNLLKFEGSAVKSLNE